MIVSSLGPTGFAALAWGAILLVVAAFAYLIWALASARPKRDEGPTTR